MNRSKYLIAAFVTSFLIAVQGTGLAEETDLDPFLVPTQAEPSVEELNLKRRHRMLQAHQWIGYSTLALVSTQVALGWANYGILKRQGFTPRWDRIRQSHSYLGIGSWVSYMTGASMAIFSPKLDETPNDTIVIHRKLAWIHGVGMGVLPIWGYVMAKKRSDLFVKDRYDAVAATHGAIGTATLGALAGAYITVMLR